jgi:hypothetical protein
MGAKAPGRSRLSGALSLVGVAMSGIALAPDLGDQSWGGHDDSVALLSIGAVLFAFGCGLEGGALKELLRLQEQLSEIIERQAERRAQLIEAARG